MTPTAQDMDTLGRTLYGESRGESWLGKVAVAHVILNRVEKGGWWGDTIETVCRKPWQFSCWNEDDPNRAKMEALTLLSDKQFRECLAAASAAVHELEPDPTAGSCHYHVWSIEPRWAQGVEPVAEIGRHLFYRGIR